MKTDPGYECVIQTLRTATILWRESRRFFRPFGVTEAQFNVMHLLGESDGMSQSEMSELLVVDRSNITLLLDRMAKRGWILRKDVPGDRRVYKIVLTPAAEKLWRKILPHYHKAMQGVVKGLSDRDLKTCLQVLKSMETQSDHWLKA